MARIAYRPADFARKRSIGIKLNDERTPSEIDRSRILHSAAFRRLAGKTQIFGIGQDAFFRSRLTHSLEVAQIAKGIALRTKADVEVCEAAALAHDIGHPPFGHRGEQVLARLMKDHFGFEANAQNLRVLCFLEIKFEDEPGLDLTRAVLDAVMKYREPWDGERAKFYYTDDPRILEMAEWAMQGQLTKPFECQVMDWADDVAYSSHDFEDGLHAELITGQRLRMYREEIIDHAQRKVRNCASSDFEYIRSLVVRFEEADPDKREAVAKQSTSGIINSLLRIERVRKVTAPGTPARHRWDLHIPPALRRKCQMLKSAAYVLLVNDPRVASLEARADRVIEALFRIYSNEESVALFPEPYRGRFQKAHDVNARARIACDFIAGMTDDYAERVYSRIFSGTRAALTDY